MRIIFYKIGVLIIWKISNFRVYKDHLDKACLKHYLKTILNFKIWAIIKVFSLKVSMILILSYGIQLPFQKALKCENKIKMKMQNIWCKTANNL